MKKLILATTLLKMLQCPFQKVVSLSKSSNLATLSDRPQKVAQSGNAADRPQKVAQSGNTV